MREYVIVTDSCCDFSQDLIRDLDLTVIPLSVQLGRTGSEIARTRPQRAMSFIPV
ncbi:MAG: DegV family protein [Evtepia gabavorous]